MENKEILLQVKNLNKTFNQKGVHVVAIDNVSFDLHAGESIGLIGESGSGKTTIARTIINLNKATSGQIILNNKNIATKKIKKSQKHLLRNNIQMIFQDPYSSLNEQKNIMHIVSEPLKILKQGTHMIKEIYRNKYQIDRYYNATISKEIKKHKQDFSLYANKIAINFYKKIIKNLKDFQPNHQTKKEDFNLLFSQYYGLKFEANTLINDKLLSISPSIFDKWNSIQNKVDNKIFEYNEEKEELVALEKLNEAKEKASFSINYINTKKEKDNLVIIKEEYNKFLKEKLLANKNLLNNAFYEWKNLTKISLRKLHLSKTFKEYELLKIDYILIKQIFEFVHNIKYKFKCYINSANFLESLRNVYNTMTIKAIKIFDNFNFRESDEFKKFEKEIIENEDLKKIKQKTLKENLITHKKAKEIIFKSFKKENDIQFNSFLDIVSKIKKLSSQLKIFIKEPAPESDKLLVNTLQEKYEIANKKLIDIYEKTEKEYFFNQKRELEIHDSKILEQNNLLENYKKEAKYLFDEKVKTIFDSDKMNDESIDNNLKLSHLKKWTYKEIRKKENENLILEKNIKNNQKRLKIIQDFMVSKNKINLNKIKLKKILLTNKVYKILEDVGLTKAHAYRYPHEFSGGMRQRVGIARAMISNPKIIIADEPIAALDLSIQAQIVNLLKALQTKEKLSMIFIAHDLSMVRHVSDKLLIIHLGKIVEYGKTENIFANPIHPYTKNLIASMPDIKKISKGFSDTNFAPTYLENYSVFNKPKYHKINIEHFVLADSNQIKLWKK